MAQYLATITLERKDGIVLKESTRHLVEIPAATAQDALITAQQHAESPHTFPGKWTHCKLESVRPIGVPLCESGTLTTPPIVVHVEIVEREVPEAQWMKKTRETVVYFPSRPDDLSSAIEAQLRERKLIRAGSSSYEINQKSTWEVSEGKAP